MMQRSKRIIAAFLAIILILSVSPMSTFATQSNTPKEEVVYINLNSDGSVKEINVVNIFDLDENGKIIDYGSYESVRNMTTTDIINYQDNTITIDADAGKLYYEGKLKDNVMPWTISIKYFMNGTEYTPKDIAGMSGNLEIRMTIRQNQSCDSSFFDGYALQTTFTLDTNNAANITAQGATIANVGSDKQITYTILPGSEKDIVISADVTDFEMSGISINGIRMNLDIDIDDSTLQDKVNDIIGAVNDLDEGAGELNSGASELYDATGKLDTAAAEMYTGVGSLYNGASGLSTGLANIALKNGELTGAAWSAYEALCTAAQTELNTKLSENGHEAVTLTPATYSGVLMGLLAEMDADAVYNTAYNTALTEATAQVEAQADSIYAEYIQSQADTIYLVYVQSQADSLYENVATTIVMQQFLENNPGLSEAQAEEYLRSEAGQSAVANTVAAMTEEQKSQIISTAVLSLTDSQKEQILQGALASLTEEQKAEILNTCIEQVMASDEVTGKINAAVNAVSSSAAEISALKGQLDNYGAFYNGLVSYTNAVSSAANGANTLTGGLSTLYSNTEILKDSIGTLHVAVGTLKDGTNELDDGTGQFVEETTDMDTKVSDEIDSITSSLTGEDIETVSFVSIKNTNIKSVQFVIQTESIEICEPSYITIEEAEQLTFWQKLLDLF